MRLLLTITLIFSSMCVSAQTMVTHLEGNEIAIPTVLRDSLYIKLSMYDTMVSVWDEVEDIKMKPELIAVLDSQFNDIKRRVIIENEIAELKRRELKHHIMWFGFIPIAY